MARSQQPPHLIMDALKGTRFCPFMRKLTREHWRTAQDRVAESYKDRFGKCIGEKCMAYANGRCKRLEREGAQ